MHLPAAVLQTTSIIAMAIATEYATYNSHVLVVFLGVLYCQQQLQRPYNSHVLVFFPSTALYLLGSRSLPRHAEVVWPVPAAFTLVLIACTSVGVLFALAMGKGIVYLSM
jgi:hypothetical protein